MDLGIYWDWGRYGDMPGIYAGEGGEWGDRVDVGRDILDMGRYAGILCRYRDKVGICGYTGDMGRYAGDMLEICWGYAGDMTKKMWGWDGMGI